METLTKAELIAQIENSLPDDARVVVYSVNADEYYAPEDGELFRKLDEEEIEQCDVPEGATHVVDLI